MWDLMAGSRGAGGQGQQPKKRRGNAQGIGAGGKLLVSIERFTRHTKPTQSKGWLNFQLFNSCWGLQGLFWMHSITFRGELKFLFYSTPVILTYISTDKSFIIFTTMPRVAILIPCCCQQRLFWIPAVGYCAYSRLPHIFWTPAIACCANLTGKFL